MKVGKRGEERGVRLSVENMFPGQFSRAILVIDNEAAVDNIIDAFAACLLQTLLSIRTQF